ncbi:MAG: flagellar hook-length control protein FliK [Deltaproteobacteria bacterium]|nr:flagellar hook-length control protein FliK [Deltaproteobacteria bacterium]
MPKLPGPLLVASAMPRNPSAAGTPVLSRGQAIAFQVLPPGRPGEARIRIGAQVFSAVASRPLTEGAAGKAVVKNAGPPLLLQVTEWTRARKPGRELPVLLGKEPLAGGTPIAPLLEKWNASLKRQLLPEASPPSPERLRAEILLSRFLVFALASPVEGEKPGRSEPLRAAASIPPPLWGADPGQDTPFWFFIPMPGERGPLLFPGYRRKEQEQSPASWAIFLRLPDVGPVSARFVPSAAGWRVVLHAENEALVEAMSKDAGDLAGRLKEAGFPLHDVAVRKMPKGQLEAEVGARMSRDTGISLVEKSA